MKLQDKINGAIGKVVNRFTSLSQAENAGAQIEKTVTDGMPELLRKGAAEGAVLLKNNNILPLKKGTKVALFGRTSRDYFFVGYGSGGDVNRPYAVNVAEGISNCDDLILDEELESIYTEWRNANPINHGFWAHWPLRYEEMPLTDETVSSASDRDDVAVVTIGRSSGEDRDCDLDNGSYFLDDEEIKMLDKVTAYFENVIVLLNVGNIIDMSWVNHYGEKIGAIMYVWQGGMESGNAVADLLCGKVCPSGRLSDTIVQNYFDYPACEDFGNKKVNYYSEDIYVGYRFFETFAQDKVLYPFGFGMSYTSFDIKKIGENADENGIDITLSVTNTGDCAGKEVVQLYVKKPESLLGVPARELVAFGKTKELAPGESQELTLSIEPYQLTSYDDCGLTNHAGCYMLMKGEYIFYCGENVRDAEEVLTYYQEKKVVFEEHKQICAPKTTFKIYSADYTDGETTLRSRWVAKEKYDLATRIMNNLPDDIPMTGNVGIKLQDVKDGKNTLDEFVAQLDLTELEAITRGDYKMDSPLGAKGNAGAYGGVLQSLRDKGVPPVITTDGPSGIRLQSSCSLLPIGTLIACSFNTELTKKMYEGIAGEMKEKGSDVLLAPGMNIHRNPLCGRNFEYFSEDPYLTGKMAAATVMGIQSKGGSACPKHFACNNQEYKRNTNNSVVSERALREIYLKGFEICIKDAKPKNIMTSYNKVNDVWSHYNYDLCTTVLRGEWGYEGNVMTDWWMKSSKSPEFPGIKDQAYRVRSQVDLLMPGGDRVTDGKPDGTLLASYGKQFGITLGEMQRSAKNILKSVMEIKL